MWGSLMLAPITFQLAAPLSMHTYIRLYMHTHTCIQYIRIIIDLSPGFAVS